MFRTSPTIRGIVAGLAGGIVWFFGLLLFFGPAQLILSNPEFQSEKMLAVFTNDPLPRTVEAPWILIAGLLIIGSLWGVVYTRLSENWEVKWFKRGLRFGIVSWTLMAPWFVFYLPWNVLHEPALLAALELICWAGVLLLVGLAIAGIENLLYVRSKRIVA